MRSSPSAPNARKDPPLDPGPAGFAHRGLHGPGVPENSLAAFRAAIAIGAGIECDVRLAHDDVPVVFHDADLRRLCGDPSRVAALSSAALTARRLGGTGEAIPRLAELLGLTRRRVPLLIECKTGRASPARLCAAVARTIGEVPGPVGVMSFDPRVAAWFARHRPDVRRGLVLSGNDGPLARWARVFRARPQFLAIDVARLGDPWVQRLRGRMPVYGWTVRTPDQRRRALADALIWEADGRP